MEFLFSFSDLFIPHHRSLNFRALVLASMIAAKKNISASDYAAITEIASEIYGKDIKRCNTLLKTTRDIVNKITTGERKLDTLLINIDNELISTPRFVKKVDFSHLRRLMLESDEEDALSQRQVYEYMLSEVNQHTKK